MNLIATAVLAVSSIVTQRFDAVYNDDYIVKDIPTTNGVYNIAVAEAQESGYADEASNATVGSPLATSIASKLDSKDNITWAGNTLIFNNDTVFFGSNRLMGATFSNGFGSIANYEGMTLPYFVTNSASATITNHVTSGYLARMADIPAPTVLPTFTPWATNTEVQISSTGINLTGDGSDYGINFTGSVSGSIYGNGGLIYCTGLFIATGGFRLGEYFNLAAEGGGTATFPNKSGTVAYLDDIAESRAGYAGALMSDIYYPQSYGQIVWEENRWKIKSADPTYPEAHKGFIATVTEATNIARAEAAPIATNAAEAVVGAVMEYALTNLTGATVTLASGQIGNLTLTSAQTALTLDLNFSSAANRSGDALLYLVNAADTELAVGPSASITPIGYKASDKLKAGTNLVAVTRLAYSGGKSVVNVAIKEVK